MKPFARFLTEPGEHPAHLLSRECASLADGLPLAGIVVDAGGAVVFINRLFRQRFSATRGGEAPLHVTSVLSLTDQEWAGLWADSSGPKFLQIRCALPGYGGTLLPLSSAQFSDAGKELLLLLVLDVPAGNSSPREGTYAPGDLDDWVSAIPSARGSLDRVDPPTGRDQKVEAADTREQEFRTLLDDARDVAYRLNVTTRRFDYISPSSMAVLGLTPSECMEESFQGGRTRVHPDDLDMFDKSLDATVRLTPGSIPETLQYRWRHGNGQYRLLNDTRSLIRDLTGRPLAVVGSLRDITDRQSFIEDLSRANEELRWEVIQRRVAQRALRESETRYRAIVENQKDLVCRFKSDGTISFVNASYCAFFGVSGEDCVGKAYTALVYPDDYSMVQTQIGELSPVRPSVTLENRVVRADGEMRWVQWTIHALHRNDGVLVEYQSAGRDITEKRNAEQLLATQYEITSVLAESTALAGAMRKVLESLSTRFEWDLVALWSADPGKTSPRLELVCRPQHASRSLTVPKTGIPERVSVNKKVVWWTAGENDDDIHAPGFQTVVAIPVRAGNALSAIIECFSSTRRPPRPDLVETMEAIGHQIGNYRQRMAVEESLRNAAELLEEKVRRRTDQLAGALEALSESEQRFRTMIENAPLGIVLVNHEGIITERNQSLERMIGCAEGGLFGVHFASLISPEDRDKVRDLLHHDPAPEHEAQRVEVRFLHPEGIQVWGSVNASPLALSEQNAAFTVIMVKDITDRKAMEEELRRREYQFRTMFEEAPIGIALLDASGRYLRTNQALNEMLAYPPGTLDGMSLRDVVHPEDLEEDLRNLQAVVEGRYDRYHLERRYIRRDGTVAWGNLNGTAILGGNGEFLYCLRIVEDITQKKETEQQIHMLAHTITSMNECVIITDVAYRILTVNKAFTRTFGYDPEEVRHRSVALLAATDGRRAGVKELLEGTLRGGWTGELSAVRKGGERFPVLLSTSVVRDEQGEPIALVGIVRDVTEQKRLQQMVVDTEQRRSEDLRRFAISVQKAQEEERQRIARELHDDICQRLSGMKLNMEVLEDEIHESDRKTSRVLKGFRKQLEQTISEVRRLSSNLRPAVLDDFGLTIALNLLVREFERGTGIKVRLESKHLSAQHLDPQVEIALYRIAQESLTNVARHAGASQVSLQLLCRDDRAELTVCDNGHGFDAVKVMNVREKGHGMGLINMKERAELLGGTWEITTTQSGGTTIRVTVPLEGSKTHEENPDPHR
jgi:PAS domain S-box-containing protein